MRAENRRLSCRGTNGSNPSPSSGESANHQFLDVPPACNKTLGETRVKTEINLEIKVAFLTAYSCSHRSDETWRAGRLMSLNSNTVEQRPHGRRLQSVEIACGAGL